jgi:hypothetical protein
MLGFLSIPLNGFIGNTLWKEATLLLSIPLNGFPQGRDDMGSD